MVERYSTSPIELQALLAFYNNITEPFLCKEA